MTTKVLLTGSTSYLGTKFTELYGDRFDILGVSRSDPANPVDLSDAAAVRSTYERFQPDVVVHMSADLGRDTATADSILQTNPTWTAHLVDLAQADQVPFLLTSTEAVYGGKETDGQYSETDPFQPRSSYGESKVRSEKIVASSGLPYLITPGHRYVGVSQHFNRPKQFPDTLRALLAGKPVRLDSRKLFTPTLINNICDILAHYVNDPTDQVIINIGVDRATTYYDFVKDVAATLSIDEDLVRPGGDEAGWPQNSTLSLRRIQELDYPTVTYEQLLNTIRADIEVSA